MTKRNQQNETIAVNIPAVFDVPLPTKIRAATDQAAMRVTFNKNAEAMVISALANGLKQKLADCVAKKELQGEEALEKVQEVADAIANGIWARAGGGTSATPLEREMKAVATVAAERHFAKKGERVAKSSETFKNAVNRILETRKDAVRAKAEENLANTLDIDIELDD